MKILVLANSAVGLYNFRRELLEALCGAGHEVVVCLPEQEERLPYRNVPVFMQRRGTNPIKDLKLLSAYKKIIRAERPELVLTYTIKCNIYGGMAAKSLKVPYAANITGLGTAFSGGAMEKLVTFLYKRALKKADAVFFENAANRKVFLDKKIAAEQKCRLLCGAGVNLGEFAFLPLPKGEATEFLFLGRIMREKGVDELFAAAQRFKAEQLNARFTFVGGFEDDYEQQVAELAGRGVIDYKGFQADVKPFIAAAHCTVLPSYHEGMSNTLLESAAMGRPLIASDIPGCREAIENGVSGYTANVRDGADLFEKLKKFHLAPLAEKRAMGEASRRLMEEKFDRAAVIKATMDSLPLR